MGKMLTTGARLLTGALFLAGLADGAAAEELKIAHFMSPKHPMHRFVMAPFAEELAQVSGGALTAKIYPAGELGKGPKQQYKRAVDGVADITFGIPGYTETLFPRAMMVAIPGVVPGAVEGTRMLWAAEDYLRPEYKRVKLLAMWTNAPAVLISRDKPVRSFDDVKGMKIRAPSAADIPVIESWGAVPVQMNVNETYNALQTGIVDAVMIGSSGIGSFKLHEPGNYVTTGLPASSAAFYLIMNQGTWDGLSGQEKAWVDQISGFELSMKGGEGYAAAGRRGLKIAREAGLEMIEFTPAESARFSDASAPVVKEVLDEFKADGQPADEILAAMRQGLT